MLSELESALRNRNRASELDDLQELMSIGHGWSRLVKEKLEKASTVQELEQLAKEGGMLRIEMPHIATVQSRYEDALKWLDETKDALTETNYDHYEKWLHNARRILLQHERIDMITERIESAQKWRQSARSLFCKPTESLVDALGHRYLVHEQLNLQANRTSSALDTACPCRDEKPGWTIQCDFCDVWYHGQCISNGFTQMYVTKSTVGQKSVFQCPICCKRKGVPYPFEKPMKDRPALDDVLALLKDGSELQTKVPEFAVIASIAEEATQWKTRALAFLAECPLTELDFDEAKIKVSALLQESHGSAAHPTIFAY